MSRHFRVYCVLDPNTGKVIGVDQQILYRTLPPNARVVATVSTRQEARALVRGLRPTPDMVVAAFRRPADCYKMY